MAYNYETEKKEIFTEEGQRQFLQIRDTVQDLLKKAGAVRMEEATARVTGNSWTHLACVDRLVELGEIREIPQQSCAGQFRIFVSTKN